MSANNLRIISGNATADEVAAVMAVITAIAASAEVETIKPVSNWSNPAAMHRRPLPISWLSSFSR
ncbi:MAG: acyl-CoA carboxylase subunit epsilon [Candidatus Nanopelagicales bacterium]